jgi:endogenous inhibitor of DNA gyrase (YacG/DUF329 family)
MVINDQYILDNLVNKNNKIIAAKLNKKWLENNIDVKTYLENRYKEFVSYSFVVKRIIYNIHELPKCLNCGKTIYNITGKYCSTKCQLTDPNFIKERELKIDRKEIGKKISKTKNNWSDEYKKEYYSKCVNTKIQKYGKGLNLDKIKKTCLKRYGVENVYQSQIVKDKIKQTKKEKYGNEYYLNPEKQKETMLAKYNSLYFMGTDDFYIKSKETKKEKYGNEYYLNPEKQKQTLLKRYGVDNPGKLEKTIKNSHSIQALEKSIETKRKNKTFNTSKPEEQTYILLKEKYPDVIRQYKSDVYPFCCDFYIPSLDLYIECNYSWTHGGHPFDVNNIDDINILLLWESKHTKYYDNAIYTWTVRDIDKRITAFNNKLNYIEVWNINEIYELLK